MTIFIPLTTLLYAFASLWQGMAILGKNPSKIILWLIGLPAICFHAYLLYKWIDIGFGQNLYLLNVFSLIVWMGAGLVLISSFKKPVQNLFIFIFPLAIVSILLVNQFPGMYVIDTGHHLSQFVHVVFSTLALSVLGVAAFQAVLLLLQDIFLRSKQSNVFLRILPPVETLESLLFEIIGLGFILLGIVLLISIITYPSLNTKDLTHSPYLAILAWIVFAILLWGHYRLGWRGRTAIRWTMGGVAILVLSYFGNLFLAGMSFR